MSEIDQELFKEPEKQVHRRPRNMRLNRKSKVRREGSSTNGLLEVDRPSLNHIRCHVSRYNDEETQRCANSESTRAVTLKTPTVSRRDL